MKKIFSFFSYKDYLKYVIENTGRGSVAKLADAAGCNRTYLSQCLSSKVQLTPDHIMGVADFLGLKSDEQDYLMFMLLLERSNSKTAQARIKEKMSCIAKENSALSKKIIDRKDSNELVDEQRAQYYSTWKYAAVHTLASIPEFQTSSAISTKLHLDKTETLKILQELQVFGLLVFTKGRWCHTGNSIHVPTGSSHTIQNHINWRLRSFEDVNNEKSVHYTTVFSLTKSDWKGLREHLVSFIEEQRSMIHQSGTEEMYCFSCDLFQPF